MLVDDDRNDNGVRAMAWDFVSDCFRKPRLEEILETIGIS